MDNTKVYTLYNKECKIRLTCDSLHLLKWIARGFTVISIGTEHIISQTTAALR